MQEIRHLLDATTEGGLMQRMVENAKGILENMVAKSSIVQDQRRGHGKTHTNMKRI